MIHEILCNFKLSFIEFSGYLQLKAFKIVLEYIFLLKNRLLLLISNNLITEIDNSYLL